MNYDFSTLKADFFFFERRLNQLESKLVTMMHPTRKDLQQILNCVNALQYFPKGDQCPLEREVIDGLKYRHRVSDLLISTFEKNQDRINASRDLASENIKSAMKSPQPIVPNQIFGSIRNLIDGYRTQLQLEEEVMIPMILALKGTDTDTKQYSAQSKDCANKPISVVIMQPGTQYLH